MSNDRYRLGVQLDKWLYLVVFWSHVDPLRGEEPSMAISPKMLAVLQKVDAARAEFFAGLRDSAKRDAEAKVRTKKRPATRAAARAKNSPTS